MQSFTDIPEATSLTASRAPLLANDNTALSCSSGTAFPVTGLQVGMLCFRTDENKLYELKDLTPTWMLLLDLSGASAKVALATALTSRNIDGVGFDGTTDVLVLAPATHAATSKATPVDADELPMSDSAGTWGLKKITWGNVKVTLKTYFDTLYAKIGAVTTGGITMTTARLLGRSTAENGAVEEIALGTGLSFSGTTLNLPAEASKAEMEAGTETALRQMTPSRVAQAHLAGGFNKHVTDATDIALADVASSYSNFGASFTHTIPVAGMLRLTFTGRLRSDAAGGAQLMLGVRIGATNYWLGAIPARVIGGVSSPTVSGPILLNSGSASNDYAEYIGAGGAATSGIAGSLVTTANGMPTGSQTLQLIVARQAAVAGSLRGTTTTSRVLIETIKGV